MLCEHQAVFLDVFGDVLVADLLAVGAEELLKELGVEILDLALIAQDVHIEIVVLQIAGQILLGALLAGDAGDGVLDHALDVFLALFAELDALFGGHALEDVILQDAVVHVVQERLGERLLAALGGVPVDLAVLIGRGDLGADVGEPVGHLIPVNGRSVRRGDEGVRRIGAIGVGEDVLRLSVLLIAVDLRGAAGREQAQRKREDQQQGDGFLHDSVSFMV